MKTFGFIGAGNMGGALATAVCRTVAPEDVTLCDRDAAKVQALAQILGCRTADVKTLAETCDCVFLGVKPQGLKALAEEIAPVLNARKEKPLIVSMAAGIPISFLRERLGNALPIIRIMPNTPAAVGAGMILACGTETVDETMWKEFFRAMTAAGRIDRLDESLIDAAGAVSGCGPAYVYLFIEALADGGVLCGLPREKAQLYAAQTVLGAAKTVLDTGKHPGALKDAVCSPGGTTIAGVQALENAAFRAAAIQAVSDAFEKTKKLQK